MAVKATHAPSLEGQLRAAEALEAQNRILAAIAAGSASAGFIDSTFAQLLDGTNTTAVFWSWWEM